MPPLEDIAGRQAPGHIRGHFAQSEDAASWPPQTAVDASAPAAPRPREIPGALDLRPGGGDGMFIPGVTQPSIPPAFRPGSAASGTQSPSPPPAPPAGGGDGTYRPPADADAPIDLTGDLWGDAIDLTGGEPNPTADPIYQVPGVVWDRDAPDPPTDPAGGFVDLVPVGAGPIPVGDARDPYTWLPASQTDTTRLLQKLSVQGKLMARHIGGEGAKKIAQLLSMTAKRLAAAKPDDPERHNNYG